jgi:hypothetical protein
VNHVTIKSVIGDDVGCVLWAGMSKGGGRDAIATVLFSFRQGVGCQVGRYLPHLPAQQLSKIGRRLKFNTIRNLRRDTQDFRKLTISEN